MLFLKPTKPSEHGVPLRKQLAQLDLLGQVFLFPSMVCLLLALEWGGTTYPWSNGRIIALFVVFGVTLIGFILSQVFRPQSATITAKLLTPDIIAATIFVFFLNSAMLLVL